jgi:hypothetical protein
MYVAIIIIASLTLGFVAGREYTKCECGHILWVLSEAGLLKKGVVAEVKDNERDS